MFVSVRETTLLDMDLCFRSEQCSIGAFVSFGERVLSPDLLRFCGISDVSSLAPMLNRKELGGLERNEPIRNDLLGK
jgi:hypothetical protein